MVSDSNKIGRRNALKAIGIGLGVTTASLGATARTPTSDFATLVRELNDVIDRHGSVVDTNSQDVGRHADRVQKRLVFEDGHQERLTITRRSRTTIVVTWDEKQYILDKNTEVFDQTSSSGPVAHAENTVETAEINPPNNESGWRDVTIGSDEYWTTETHSRARTKNDWLGTAQADTSGTECQVATDATVLGIPGAYAQTWVSFAVDSTYGEPDDKHADFEINTERAVNWLCATVPGGGAGSGGWKVGAYVWNYESGSFIDKEVIANGWVGPEDFRWSIGSSTTNIGVNLEAGKHYGVGIYAGCHSATALISKSIVDIHPSGDFDGGFSWEDISLDWS